jgi:hypothetical protein
MRGSAVLIGERFPDGAVGYFFLASSRAFRPMLALKDLS